MNSTRLWNHTSVYVSLQFSSTQFIITQNKWSN